MPRNLAASQAKSLSPPLVRVVLVLLALPLGCQSASPPAPASRQVLFSVASSAEPVILRAVASLKSSDLLLKTNAGPSNALAQQIMAGAPVDLFLSASREWADAVTSQQPGSRSVTLFSNSLVVIVPRSLANRPENLSHLVANTSHRVALAGEAVPAGKYAEQALRSLGHWSTLSDQGRILRGQDVSSVVRYVETGNAQAGLVYATDARDANVQILDHLEPQTHAPIEYCLVLTQRGASSPQVVRLFDDLQSPAAQRAYHNAGFLTPSAGGPRHDP